MGNGGLEAYLQLTKNKSEVVNACPPNKIDEKTTQNEARWLKVHQNTYNFQQFMVKMSKSFGNNLTMLLYLLKGHICRKVNIYLIQQVRD